MLLFSALLLPAGHAAPLCVRPHVAPRAQAWGVYLGMSESEFLDLCKAESWSCDLKTTDRGYREASFHTGYSGSATQPDTMRVRVVDGVLFAVRAHFRDDDPHPRGHRPGLFRAFLPVPPQ